jgi:lysophospholipase L1-like esterase
MGILLLGSAPLYIGPGDVKPGAFAWWGLRAYSASSIGMNAVSILRASDSTTQIFTTVAGGGIDATAIATFLSGTTGKISKLWDQTGNGRHLTQATSANMPDYVQGDVRMGGILPSLHFVKASQQILTSAATGLSTSACTMSSLSYRDQTSGNYDGILQAGGNGHGFNATLDQLLLFAGGLGAAPAVDYSPHSIDVALNGASSVAVVDGVLTTGIGAGAGTYGSPFSLGVLNNNLYLGGGISEAGCWNSVLTNTELANLNANKVAYWLKPTVKYEGFVALRCRYPGQSGIDATNKFANFRSAHIATEALTSISVLLNPMSSGASMTASIEYPAGTFTQLKFDGSATLSIISFVWTDYVTVSIPSGATFWVRTFVNSPNGLQYNGWQNTFLGEACTLSVGSISDLTMSGTITNSNTASFPASAIIGLTSNASVMVLGDSIAAGNGDTEDTSASATGYNGKIGIIARSLGSTPFVNFGKNGAAAPSGYNRLYAKGSHVFSDFGINNIRNSDTSATLITDLSIEYQAKRPTTKLYQTTLTPNSPGGLTAPQATERVTFNTVVRGGTTGLPLTGFIDVAGVLESPSNSNTWQTLPSGPYTGDNLHPNTAGYALVQAANLIPAPVWP